MSDVTPSQAVHQVTAAERKGESAHEPPERQEQDAHDSPEQEASHKEHRVEDVAFILGIPASEVTPQIQKGLSGVMKEFERQRLERDFLRKRVAFLEKRCDAHPFLPVMSRHALERTMNKVLNRADQAQTDNSFVCLQVDGLETVRREQGLSVADSIVTAVAKAVIAELRASDVVGSMGGYGLGIIFTVTSAAGAAEKAEALGAVINAGLQAAHPGVRMVYGVHPMQGHETVAAIFAAADEDLRGRARHERRPGGSGDDIR